MCISTIFYAQEGEISSVINDITVEINLGKNNGIAENDVLEVYGKAQYKHPTTGELIISNKILFGEITVVSVDDNVSYATVNSSSEPLSSSLVVKKIPDASLQNVQGNVAKILNEKTIEINLGKNQGFSKNDKFEVFGKGQYISPTTGESHNSNKILLGKILIFIPKDSSSIASVIYSTQTFSTDNIVLPVNVMEQNKYFNPNGNGISNVVKESVSINLQQNNLSNEIQNDSLKKELDKINRINPEKILIENTQIQNEYSISNSNISNVKNEVQEVKKYDRSALTMFLVRKTDKTLDYQSEIDSCYEFLEMPDKYDEMSTDNIFLDLRGDEISESQIESKLEADGVGRELIAKWFNRNQNGIFDMSLIKDRAFYNATQEDLVIANLQKRGIAAIGDYGENLIGNTFIVVNEISYFDKEKSGKKASGVFKSISSIAGSVGDLSGINVNVVTDRVQQVSDIGALTTDILAKGFFVTIKSYLYKLEWNEEIATNFYLNYYTDSIDNNKIKKFNKAQFNIQYIGSYKARAGVQSTTFSARTQNELIVKTMYEAIDNNIQKLQKNFEVFKVKTPIIAIEPNIIAPIGMKEGVNSKTRFDVFQVVEDKDGVRKFENVGSVKPVKGYIWDNRYMADFGKGSYKGNTYIDGTYFKQINGGKLKPGMLLREAKGSGPTNVSDNSSGSNKINSNIEKRDEISISDKKNRFYFALDLSYAFGKEMYSYNDNFESGYYTYDSYQKKYVWAYNTEQDKVTREKSSSIIQLSAEFGGKFGLFVIGGYSEIYTQEGLGYTCGLVSKLDLSKSTNTPYIGLRAGIGKYSELQAEAGFRFNKFTVFYKRTRYSSDSENYMRLNSIGVGFLF